MHTDGRLLENNSLIEGDICIVGAGAAGISMALDWNNTPYKVILLEGGGFEYDPEVQDLYRGKTTGQPYYPLMSSTVTLFRRYDRSLGLDGVLRSIPLILQNEAGWNTVAGP